ncbi:hypothetical protein [Streptococcus zalophi]|uniref:Nudix hydrolase domain-containing protein n=1 Tax=Streptococcus zalophi TaxID=640031 RepID=A0A934UDE9_9STRE|nr:hypothetical protein [Streptococcus zalophi]MBJ8349727.1 hypothetical protein [Streptococcus zalophi]
MKNNLMLKMKDIFKNRNKYYYLLTGKVDLFFMTIRYRRWWILSIVIVVISQLIALIDYIDVLFDFSLLNILSFNKLFFLLFLFIIIFLLALYRYNYLKNNIEIYSLSSNEQEKIKKLIKLNQKYLQSGYQIKTFNRTNEKEYYVISDDINRYLQTNNLSINTRKKNNYHIPREIQDFVPKIMYHNLKKDKFMNNGNLLKQNNSLLFDDNNKIKTMTVSKSNYYDGQCTHEIVYKNFMKTDEIGIKFEGINLMLDNNILNPLEQNRSANFLGASTIVFTSDNKILIGLQGKYSKSNANRYAPSGSGSVDWYLDYKKRKINSFNDIIINAMEREFLEEWGLSSKNLKLKTKIIGYARLIERGGKPDYFGLSFVNKTFDELREISKGSSFISHKEEGLQQVSDILPVFENISDISVSIEEVCKTALKEDRLSIQIYLIKEIINKMIQDKEFEPFMKDLGLN